MRWLRRVSNHVARIARHLHVANLAAGAGPVNNGTIRLTNAQLDLSENDIAKATGAQTLAVGCPFCITMLGDAATADGGTVAVKDVAEIVVERLLAGQETKH